MIDLHLFLYLCIVGFFGILLIWWSRKKLLKVQSQKRSRIKTLKHFETIKTKTPIDHPVRQAKESADENIQHRFTIIRKLSFYSIIVIWFISMAFPFLNEIPAAFVSVMVAASGIILGIAARPYIENLISGIVISFSQPIRIGDAVLIDNNYGTVEDISITHTTVKVWNWRRYIIPNSRMLAKEILNCTIKDNYQWKHVEFFVAYDNDIRLVKDLAVKAAAASKHFADYESPRFWVMEMGEKGYKCWVAAWADSPIDAWELGNDIRTELIKQFQAHGIKTHRFEIDTAFPKNIRGQTQT